MFSIETPAKGMVQLLTPDDNLLVHEISPQGKFYAHASKFAIGHWGQVKSSFGEPRPVSAHHFEQSVIQGYQLSSTGSHGRISMQPGRGSSASPSMLQWGFEYEQLVSWGQRDGRPRCTASVLSFLPFFDPGYQVLIAHGVVTSGYIDYQSRRINVAGAVVYCEKNWGTTFPRKWWWVQANAFLGRPDLTLTAVGSTRDVIGFEEIVGMIAVHVDGKLYEFANWNCTILSWNVHAWGSWRAEAVSRSGHRIVFEASTQERAVEVLGPSRNGMVYNVWDNARGKLIVNLVDGAGNAILDGVRCEIAQVEVGGEAWEGKWEASVRPLPQPVRGIVNLLNGKVSTCP